MITSTWIRSKPLNWISFAISKSSPPHEQLQYLSVGFKCLVVFLKPCFNTVQIQVRKSETFEGTTQKHIDEGVKLSVWEQNSKQTIRYNFSSISKYIYYSKFIIEQKARLMHCYLTMWYYPVLGTQFHFVEHVRSDLISKKSTSHLV